MTQTGLTAVPLSTIAARADLLKKLREFMGQKGVMEVETPYLSKSSNPDPNLQNLKLKPSFIPEEAGEDWYLHTSPEFPMKRLLSSNTGAIYQICRVFRDGEMGSRHNPEFTMLEYYQVGYRYQQLMEELNDLLLTLDFKPANKITYRECFSRYVRVDPFVVSDDQLKHKAVEAGLQGLLSSRSQYLDYLFCHFIESNLGHDQPVFIYDYPPEQAALAKIRKVNNVIVAERFELFINGMEIANGYDELNNAHELQKRFADDIQFCRENKINYGPIDKNLLQITNDLPDCSGVAIGIDRLLMCQLGLTDINQVLCFPPEYA